jgi:DNA-binding GntR family transcriptional regulator
MAAYKYPRVVEIMDDLPKTTSGKIMRRLLQPTAHASVLPLQAELLDVSYPKLRAALEARAVLEAGAVWLRLSRGPLPLSASGTLYERLRMMLAQLHDGRTFIDQAAFFAANEAYHAAVIDLAENEHLSLGFKRLRLRELFLAALKSTPVVAENGVYFHEFLTDSLAASDASSAVKAILSWGKHSATSVRRTLDVRGDAAAPSAELRPAGIVEDLSLAVAKEQESLSGDVDALVLALDARAALEIGITQSLGAALSIETERDALVARLRAFTPLVRGTSPAHIGRYIRADDAFHRVFLSLLRNQHLFDIYNSMDLPELMRRVLVVAPISIREVFDDHKGLTNALRAGEADLVSSAITEHANRVRGALAAFLAASQEGATAA